MQVQRWRALTPVLYDWVGVSCRVWPSLSCHWGPPATPFAAKAARKGHSRQRLYFAEQTDKSAPNTLIAASVDVLLPRGEEAQSADELVSSWTGDLADHTFLGSKVLFHPGEVNKIRAVAGCAEGAEVVATHSDVPQVYLWRLAAQPDRTGDADHTPSVPDCLLTGHTAVAPFALASARLEPRLASGGTDRAVCLWDLRDHAGGALLAVPAAGAEGRKSLNSGGLGSLASSAPPQLTARVLFMGHDKSVEDVAFNPNSAELLCSVGDDSALCFWDARAGPAPVQKVAQAHGNEDIHTCDWAPQDEHLVATGSADTTVRVFDRRRVGAPLHVLVGHKAAVNVVQWCPDRIGVLASGSDDACVHVWDVAAPEPLLFHHAGHMDVGGAVADLQWSPAVPWTCCSVSSTSQGGGYIQLWRPSELIYRDQKEALAELERVRASILAESGQAAAAAAAPS